MRSVGEEIRQAARSDAKVLITGESGVGKEIVARQIHHQSARAQGPLVAINCAGIPDTLLASELFGHVRGSFTDAYADKRGWLEQADGGTVFMDEVGEMSQQMQALLLRFLESGEIQRVGSERRQTRVDVRVISATNRRLLERVNQKEFRDDLYYRLNVIHIDIPPLRDRRDDIPSLIEHFLDQFAARQSGTIRVDDDAMGRLLDWQWPGNIRELRNVVERMVLRCRHGVITRSDLPRDIAFGPPAAAALQAPAGPSRAQLLFERVVISGESFWAAVGEPFVARDLTRDDLRTIVRQGLQMSNGSYKTLVQMFNMPSEDYKKFLAFLRKYRSHMPIQEFRSARAAMPETGPLRSRAASD
jgi:DNA-binding NtrC family response regulator